MHLYILWREYAIPYFHECSLELSPTFPTSQKFQTSDFPTPNFGRAHPEVVPTPPSARPSGTPQAPPDLPPTCPTALLTRDPLAPVPPRTPFTRTSRSVTRADLALRSNGPNGPKRLRRRAAPTDSRRPNDPPTHDRNARELPRAYASAPSQPVAIQRHDGPASHAAKA